MGNIPVLFEQLKTIEENIRIFYGEKVLQVMLDRMMYNRRRMLKRILRLQVRTFNRD